MGYYCHGMAGQVARAQGLGTRGCQTQGTMIHRMEGFILSRARIGKAVTIGTTGLYV